MATKGVDLSHWNPVTNFTSVRNAGYQFCFLKATQGTTYLDPEYLGRKDKVRSAGMLLGAYHFADATDPVKEADWFVKNVGDLKKGEIVVLDYESYKLANPGDWCRKWLDRVESKLGFKPMLYTYDALLKKYNWGLVSSGNFGLWAARYGWQTQWPNPLFKPSTGSWAFYAIWQYCSKGKVPGILGNVDLNTTDMSLETLKKYGKK
jgi:lysozyme